MNPYILEWSAFVFGALQLVIFAAAYRALWKLFRKKAPVLLGKRGMPMFVIATSLGVAVPGALFMALLSHLSGALWVVFGKPWVNGLGLGLTALLFYSVATYRSKKHLKWRIGSKIKEAHDAQQSAVGTNHKASENGNAKKAI